VNSRSSSIDEYLAAISEVPRATLEVLRRQVRALAPDAVESLSYGMPAFKYRGKPLIYFAAAKNHCAIYGTSAGTLRFPHTELPPPSLIETLVKARIEAIEADLAKPGTRRSRA
jgi:uncharacterized protein YdhG (YjbR/CyaY superfamily)